MKKLVSILCLCMLISCAGCGGASSESNPNGEGSKELSIFEKAEVAIDTVIVCIDAGKTLYSANEKVDGILAVLQKNEDKLDKEGKAALELFVTAKKAADESALDGDSPEGKELQAKKDRALIALLTGLKDNEKLPADLRQSSVEILELYTNSADKIADLFLKFTDDPQVRDTIKKTVIETMHLEGVPQKSEVKDKQ